MCSNVSSVLLAFLNILCLRRRQRRVAHRHFSGLRYSTVFVALAPHPGVLELSQTNLDNPDHSIVMNFRHCLCRATRAT